VGIAVVVVVVVVFVPADDAAADAAVVVVVVAVAVVRLLGSPSDRRKGAPVAPKLVRMLRRMAIIRRILQFKVVTIFGNS